MADQSGIIKQGVPVNVYEDPITQLKLEGVFTPTEYVKSSMCPYYKMEMWYGYFRDDHHIVLRKISVTSMEV